MRPGRSASCRRWAAAAAPRPPIGGQAGKGMGAAVVGARPNISGPAGTAAAAYHVLSGTGSASMGGPRRWRQVPAAGLGVVPTRGAKVKSKMRLEDLPQGPVEPPPATTSTKAATTKRRRKGGKGQEEAVEAGEKEEPAEQEEEKEKGNEEEEEEEPAYPTVVLQARRNMRRFDNCVLLTRVGGFYELYFEHAEEYGPSLNLKVTSKKTSAGPVAMVCSPPLLFSWLLCAKKKKRRRNIRLYSHLDIFCLLSISYLLMVHAPNTSPANFSLHLHSRDYHFMRFCTG